MGHLNEATVVNQLALKHLEGIYSGSSTSFKDSLREKIEVIQRIQSMMQVEQPNIEARRQIVKPHNELDR